MARAGNPAACMKGTSLDYWTIQDDAVIWRHDPVKGADARTFEPLTDTWAKDAKRVYCQNNPWRHADVATFRVLNPLWAVDKAMAYYTYGQIKDADLDSFRALDDGIEPLEEGHFPIFAGFAADKHHVVFYAMTVGKPSKLPKADPATFEVVGPCYGRDANTAYFERLRIPGANAATLRHLGGSYCTDETSVFFCTRRVEGALPSSFVVAKHDFLMAHDSAREYLRGNAV
jgi:hypothetical protein